jgi:hypothetical protein
MYLLKLELLVRVLRCLLVKGRSACYDVVSSPVEWSTLCSYSHLYLSEILKHAGGDGRTIPYLQIIKRLNFQGKFDMRFD